MHLGFIILLIQVPIVPESGARMFSDVFIDS